MFQKTSLPIGRNDVNIPLTHRRGDQVTHSGGPNPRERSSEDFRARDIYVPDLHMDTIKVKGCNFH